MSGLTGDQRKVILMLGGEHEGHELLPEDVFQELVGLGLVRSRPEDGRVILTALGESVYGEISAEEG